MGHEDQVLYLEYRKKQNAILNDLRGLEFIISFFLGGTFTGIFKYSSNDIISNILLVTVTIMLALIYFLILIFLNLNHLIILHLEMYMRL